MNEMNNLSQNKRTIIAALITALVLLIPLMPAYDRGATLMDEATLLVYPELVLKGKLPYRDFETFYGPANIYTLAGFYSVFGVGIFVERTVGLLYHLAIL